MRSIGVDIASRGFVALGLAVNDAPILALVWKSDNERDSDAARMLQLYNWLTYQFGLLKPDIVSVERQAGFVKNHDVIRSLSKREGVALVAAKRRSGVIVLNPPVSQARGIVFGNGNISKDEAWKEIQKMYPEFKFLRKTVGGTDQADALIHAIAAPVILERR